MLATNVPLLAACLPVITIRGLKETHTLDGVVPITGDGAFNATGTWTKSSGQLVVGIDQDTVAGQNYSFSFVVNNTHQQQPEQPLAIKACIDGQPCSDSGFQTLPGDASNGVRAKPMVVRDIFLYTREVNQSNPTPCSQNDITILVSTSVPLQLSCGHLNVTLSGFVNTQTDDTDHMAITDCSGLSNPLFSSVGVWKKSQGTLKVALLHDTIQEQQYCLRFTVKNPSTGNTVSTITADIATILPATTTPLANYVLTETSASHSRTLIDTSPIWHDFLCPARRTASDIYKIGNIVTSSFTIKTVSQSNPFPCHHNLLAFALSPDVKLLAGTTLTISGLKASKNSSLNSVPTLSRDDPMMALSGFSASVFGSTGAFTQADGKLIVTVAAGAAMLPCNTYNFGITIINPTDNTAESIATCAEKYDGLNGRLAYGAATVTVQATDICIAQETLMNDVSTILPLPNTKIGDASPMQILRAGWVSKDIGQSTPYPYTRNTITITLRNIVPFVPSCPNPVKIEISGLDDLSLSGTDVPSWATSDHGVFPKTGSVMLLPLQSICVTSDEDVTDHLHFKDLSGPVTLGTAGNGFWDSKIDSDATTPRTLTVFPALETRPGNNVVTIKTFTSSMTGSSMTGGIFMLVQCFSCLSFSLSPVLSCLSSFLLMVILFLSHTQVL